MQTFKQALDAYRNDPCTLPALLDNGLQAIHDGLLARHEVISSIAALFYSFPCKESREDRVARYLMERQGYKLSKEEQRIKELKTRLLSSFSNVVVALDAFYLLCEKELGLTD